MIALLLGVALAGDPPLPPPTDLDGDGTPEAFARATEAVIVGAAKVDCGGYDFPCEVEVHDGVADDGAREVAVCGFGPREERGCELYRYAAGKLVPLPFPFPGGAYPPARLSTSGSGIVLTTNPGWLYTRTDKFLMAADGGLGWVRPAAWSVDQSVKVDRSFAITSEPGGGGVVAKVRPGTEIRVVLESAAHPHHYLVLISSGLLGWVGEEGLIGASDDLMARQGAG